jgi:cytochrome c biogenesis protein CcmG/thiol:disulfide interchange protein DsbE
VVVLAVLLVGVLAYGLLGGSAKNLDTAVQRGERPPAPAATVALPKLGSAGTETLASLRGKVVVVNLWASWCEPCKGEAPLISAIHDALVKSGEGQVLGVTYLDATSRSLKFAKDYRLTFPSVRDIDKAVYKGFEATGQPETYVLDRQGRVAAVSRGVITAEFANRALEATGAVARVPAELEGAKETTP